MQQFFEMPTFQTMILSVENTAENEVHPEICDLSAVVATVDRVEPLYRLMDSLAAQAVLPKELIIVDQNAEELPSSLIRQENFPIKVIHIHCPEWRGVSRARNIGWRQASGSWLLFPDDDCWFPPDYLRQAMAIQRNSSASIVTGRAADVDGNTINGRFESNAGPINRKNVLTSQIEWNMLISANAMKQLGGYNQSISLGGDTPWQGGEGYDLLLRAILLDIVCHYDPDLIGHHDELPAMKPDAAMLRKGRDYARGLGHILRKHGYGASGAAYWTARSFANLCRAFATGKWSRSRYFAHQLIGRLEGFGDTLMPWPKYPSSNSRKPASGAPVHMALPPEDGACDPVLADRLPSSP